VCSFTRFEFYFVPLWAEHILDGLAVTVNLSPVNSCALINVAEGQRVYATKLLTLGHRQSMRIEDHSLCVFASVFCVSN